METTTNRVLIDGTSLYDDQLEKFFEKVGEQTENLGDILQTLYKMMSGTRAQIEESLPKECFDDLISNLQELSSDLRNIYRKHFLKICRTNTQLLPPELQILFVTLEDIHGRIMMATLRNDHSVELIPPKKRRGRPPGKKNKSKLEPKEPEKMGEKYQDALKTAFERCFSEIDIDQSENKLRIHDEQLRWKLRFEPFMKTAENDITLAEKLMDQKDLRVSIATWLHNNHEQASYESCTSFYAYVTKSFRDKPQSDWKKYLMHYKSNENKV